MGEIADALRRVRQQVQAPRFVREEPIAPRAATTEIVHLPETRDTPWFARAVLVDTHDPIAQGYRHAAIRLARAVDARKARTVLVTSASPGEGKTTTACNLALALATVSDTRRIALVDLDLHRATAAKQLGVTISKGIGEVLTGKASLDECCVRTQLPQLDLFLAAGPTHDALGVISSTQVARVLHELARRYDLVLIDSPPVLPAPDVPLLLPHVDCALIVVRNGVSRLAAVRELGAILPADSVVGAFFNEARTPSHYRYYTSYVSDSEASADAMENKS